MEYTVIQLPWPQGEANQTGDRPADAEAEANRQRRKVQNRKNQRAHRKSVIATIAPTILRNPYRTTA
jgi:hypothetical protein